MDSKIVEFLTKVNIEDDEDDVVRFAFPTEKRIIKASILLLREVSPIFEVMFNERWNTTKADENKKDALDKVHSDSKTITLSDTVDFDQYPTFRLFIQILYGLRQIDSLAVDEATNVYYYAHKYQISDVERKIKEHLNERMEFGLSKSPFSVNELFEAVEFAETYGLETFKEKLKLVVLALDEDNPPKFWDLANKFKIEEWENQVLNHLKIVNPKTDWPSNLLAAVIGRLQADRKCSQNKNVKLQGAIHPLLYCPCDDASLYCYCKDYSVRKDVIEERLLCD